MLTVVDSIHPAWGRKVIEGLRGFADAPDWLLALDDPQRISQALMRWVPELSSGDLSLEDCDVKRVRLRDDTWTGQYHLSIEQGGEQRSVQLNGRLVREGAAEPPPGSSPAPFASPQWRCYAPELRLDFQAQPADAALAALPSLTDPERARTLLQSGISKASPAYEGLRIEGCKPRVMRYKPGSRCTILYELEYPNGGAERGWPNPVVAKTHHGPKGLNAHESMSALWDSPLRVSPNVTVAEPLGFLPELNVLLQGPIKEERTLKQQLRHSLASGTAEELAALSDYLEMTARGLADLHSCGVTVGRNWSFEDEMGEVRERIERLATYTPLLETAARPVLARLEGIAETYPADPFVPSHRSFRAAQVLIHANEIGFIDFDSFCQGEPALDISLFFSTFRDLSLRALQTRDGSPAPGEPPRADHMRMLDDLTDVFLGRYQESSRTPVTIERIDLWHALLVFDRVVTCWTKNRFERLPHCMALLAHLYKKDGLTSLVR